MSKLSPREFRVYVDIEFAEGGVENYTSSVHIGSPLGTFERREDAETCANGIAVAHAKAAADAHKGEGI